MQCSVTGAKEAGFGRKKALKFAGVHSSETWKEVPACEGPGECVVELE